MKRKLMLIAAISLFFSLAQAQETTYYDDSFARMNYVSGDTYVQRAQDLGLEAGAVNLAVISGDRLGTREGRLEIHLGRQNYLRMDRNTQVDVIQLPDQNRNLVKLNLTGGELYLRISYLAENQQIEVHTPDASFYVLEQGLYRIRTQSGQETEIRVIEGSVEAAGEEASEVIESLERLVAAQGRIIFGPTRLTARTSDAFSDWNSGRDQMLSRPAAQSYLPEELGAYENELAESGRWTYESSYGYVWVPHVYHDTWRPYYNGRWVWYPVIGYTWVSYESWGWCVSHYGRWQWRFGLGWYWIPRRGWSPAWVHWYHGSSHYGWCPRSYHGYPGVVINNHYYGKGYYRQYPLDSRAMVMVHKRQLQDPNISRVALGRSQARSLGKAQISSRQPAVRPASVSSRLSGTARIAPSSSIKSYSRTSAARVSSGASASRQNSTRSSLSASSSSRARASASQQSYPSRNVRSRTSTSTSNNYPSQRTSTARGSLDSSGRSVKSYDRRTTSSSRSSTVQRLDPQSGRVSPSRYPSRTTLSSSVSSHSSSSSVRAPSRTQSVRTNPPASSSRSSASQSRSSASTPSSSSVRSAPRSSSSGSRSASATRSRSSSSSGKSTASRGSSSSRSGSSRVKKK